MTNNQKPEIPDSLKHILIPDQKPVEMLEPPTLPGTCPIHGEVGFGRFILHDSGEILAEYCARCLQRVLSAIIPELQYDEPEDDKK